MTADTDVLTSLAVGESLPFEQMPLLLSPQFEGDTLKIAVLTDNRAPVDIQTVSGPEALADVLREAVQGETREFRLADGQWTRIA